MHAAGAERYIHPVKRAIRPGDVGVVLALAAVYFAAAKLGFTMAFVAEQVTVVWPPTGIAFAAVVLFGVRVWPGILLGAFLANVMAHETIATATAIAAGNTLEAVVGAALRAFVARRTKRTRMIANTTR